MTVIALTGGIGSGKSEVARLFAIQGVPIVDVDVIAHELTAIGEPLLKDIHHIFGDVFFNIDGSLNRKKLRTRVFELPEERLKLETLLHPAIHTRALEQLAVNERELHPIYQLLVIPLLFENNHYKNVIDKIIVVDCDESLQIQRAMARSKLKEHEVKAILNAQVTRATRLSAADEVILNDGSLEELQRKVAKTHVGLIKTCIKSK